MNQKTPNQTPPTPARSTEQILQEKVLVLNRVWQAIRVTNVETAIKDMCRGALTAIDEDTMIPIRWETWLTLPVEGHKFLQTLRGPIRVPEVVAAVRYDKMPKKRPKLTNRAIGDRDKRICQYTNRYAPDGNVDHVVPVGRGGAKRSWRNMVWAAKDVNSKKGDRLNHEVGLQLLRQPKEPKDLPAIAFIEVPPDKPHWEKFVKGTN